MPVRQPDDAGLAAVNAAIADLRVLARYRAQVATVPGVSACGGPERLQGGPSVSAPALLHGRLGTAVRPPPREWGPHKAQLCEISSELDESFVPKPPSHHGQRDVPRTPPTTDRPAPGH